jgi:hypothetical protein
VRNLLESTDTEFNTKDRYNRMKSAIYQAAKEAMGHRDDKGKVGQPWWNEKVKLSTTG